MDAPIELLTFVTRAENRIAVLRALSTGPHTRPDLETATDIPRATLSRILADCRDRDLVTRTDHEYDLTPLGSVLLGEFESLLETVTAMQTLQTVRDWLAFDEYDIPIERLSDADVIVPEPSDPMAPVRRAEELLAMASEARILAYNMVPGCLEASWRAVTDGQQTFEGVLTARALETMLEDPTMASQGRELLTADNAQGYLHSDQTLPLVFVVDDVVFLAVVGDAGTIQGHIETTDSEVRQWANETIDRYVAEAEPLGEKRLTA